MKKPANEELKQRVVESNNQVVKPAYADGVKNQRELPISFAPRSSEETLKSVQKIAKIGIWSWEIATNRAGWSDQLYEIFRAPRKKPSYDFARSFVHAEDVQLWEATVQQAVKRQEPFALDYRAIRADHKTIWVHNETQTIFNEHGEFVGYQGIIQDITERKRAEEALHDRKKRFSLLLKSVNDALFVHEINNRKTGKFIQVNDVACKRLGYSRDELLQMSPKDIDARDMDQARHSAYDLLTENGQCIFEMVHLTKSGNKIPVEISSRMFESEGKQLVLSIARDITRRKQAEEALRSEREKLYTIFEGMKDGVCIVNQNYDIEFINAAAKKEFGEVGNRKCYDYFCGRTEACPWCKNNDVFNGKSVHWEHEVRNQKIYDLIATPLKHTDGSVSKLEIFRDISDRKRIEEELKLSETKYRHLVENMSEVIYIIDRSGIISYVSPSVLKLAQYSPTEIIGGSAENFIYKKDLPRFRKKFEDALAGKEISENEYRIVTKSGNIRWVQTSANPVYTGSEITAVQGLLLDTTERKRAEEALRESEDRFRAIFNNAAVGMALTSMDGHVLKANVAFCRFLGYSQEEFTGLHFSEVTHPEDLDADINLYQELIAGLRTGYNLDKRYMKKDGTVVWGRLGLSVIRDEDGLPRYAIGTCEDITDRKRAEEELRESEEKFRSLVEATSDWIWEVDVKGRYAYASPQVRDILGYEPEEVLGRKPFDFMPSDESDRVQKEFFTIAKDHKAFAGLENVNIGKDGRRVVLETSGVPKLDVKGDLLGYRGIDRDITDRKHAEEILKMSRDKLELSVRERTAELEKRAGQLAKLSSELTLTEQRERRRLAEILHDHLQQLLVGAKINCEILSAGIGPEHKPVAENVVNLINQSLQTSRSLTAELSPPVLQQGSLSAALEWLARWMQEKHGFKVELKPDPSSDPDQEDITILLFQSVRELLLNVLKHAGVKSARVEMSRDENKRLRVRVIDQGVGFDLNTILENADGTRFGLFSIRERIELLGGSMKIESSPGKGSTFSLFVPLEKLGQKDKKCEQKLILKIQKAKKALDKIRVLVADDHTVVRQGLSTMLNLHSDIEIIGEAENGQEAIEKARMLQPDVILMDIGMPKLDGIEATRIIHSELPHVRVIGLSMHDKQDQASRMIEAGASAYCTKDGATDVLISAIRAGGTNRRTQAQLE